MGRISGSWAIIALLGLRLIVPLILIALVTSILRRVDLAWQRREWSEQKRDVARKPDAEGARWLDKLARPCWEEMGCPESRFAKCPARRQASLPCWMARRWAEGVLPAECYNCERFRMRPAAESVL